MKKLYMFDCFGVLIGELAPIWFSKRYPPEEAIQLKDFYFNSADSGEKDMKTLISDLSTGLNIERDVIVKEFEEIFTINYELFDYLKVLKKRGNDIILVSNAPEGLVESIFSSFDLYKYFDNVFVSWKYKMIKPNLEYYKLCLSINNGTYDKVFMIDDNQNNLNNLESIGVTPIHFVNNENLIKELEEA